MSFYIDFIITIIVNLSSIATKEGLLNQQHIILLHSSHPPIHILSYKPCRVASKHNIYNFNHQQHTIALTHQFLNPLMRHYQNKFKLPISISDGPAMSKKLKVNISTGLGAESQSSPGSPGSTSTRGDLSSLLICHITLGEEAGCILVSI